MNVTAPVASRATSSTLRQLRDDAAGFRKLLQPVQGVGGSLWMSYSIRFHPLVARDLDTIAGWILEYADAETAERKLAEIEQTLVSLVRTPHKGSIRNEVAPGLRAIPVGRKAVIAFIVDEEADEILVHAVTYGGTERRGRP